MYNETSHKDLRHKITLTILFIIAVLIFITAIAYAAVCPVNTQFEVISHSSYGNIVYDKDTKVMYVVSQTKVYSPLYEADGSLKLYKGK